MKNQRKGDMSFLRALALTILVGVVLFLSPAAMAQTWALGDTLTVIQKPLQNIPEIVVPGAQLDIWCEADPGTTGWQVFLERQGLNIPLGLLAATYESQTAWWRLTAEVPQVPLLDLYDLRVTASGGLEDLARQSVQVRNAFPDDFYFVHITDTHLPTYLYYDENGAETDSSTTIGLRHITRDVNLINPAFVLVTGDLINEGELEDFLSRRYYSRAQRQLREFDVPVYVTAGNHDLGGWDATPPPAGTARRDWWRFFGWKRLDDPPAGAPARTQNYSFDFGPVHFVGLEAYDNYDSWRWPIYGDESFTQDQLNWLQQDLAATDRTAKVLFHHHDFAGELNLGLLGVDLALSGHIHRDTEDSSVPLAITTDNASGTNRPFRLVRFANGQFLTQPSLEAGFDGQTLTTTYQPDDSGSHDLVRVTIQNGYGQAFEDGRLKLTMPVGATRFAVEGGTLIQVDQTGDQPVCHLAVSIPAAGSLTVTLKVDDAAPAEETPTVVTRLLGAHPNPFNPRTALSFDLASQGAVRLDIFDLQGRLVRTLVDAHLQSGSHTRVWDGLDGWGASLPSGTYLAALRSEGYAETRKITLLR